MNEKYDYGWSVNRGIALSRLQNIEYRLSKISNYSGEKKSEETSFNHVPVSLWSMAVEAFRPFIDVIWTSSRIDYTLTELLIINREKGIKREKKIKKKERQDNRKQKKKKNESKKDTP